MIYLVKKYSFGYASISSETSEISLYRVTQSHVKGIAYKCVTDAHFIQPWYVLMKIMQVDEAEVVPGVKAHADFACCHGRLDERFYGFFAVY